MTIGCDAIVREQLNTRNPYKKYILYFDTTKINALSVCINYYKTMVCFFFYVKLPQAVLHFVGYPNNMLYFTFCFEKCIFYRLRQILTTVMSGLVKNTFANFI